VGYENMGSVHVTQGRWEEGLHAFEHALKIQPHWMTYSNLGTAYFFLRRYPEAVGAFERATALNPNDAINVGNLADALRWSGQRDRAARTYAQAIALAHKELQVNPRDETILRMLGVYHAKIGNDARATEYLGRARAIDARSATIDYSEAIVHTLAGRQAAALAALERALAGGYSAREAFADPELSPLATSPGFDSLLRRHLTP